MPICELCSRQDVLDLRRQVRLVSRPAAFRVMLNIPASLTRQRHKKLERRLAFCLSDCGCALASLALFSMPACLVLGDLMSLLPLWPNALQLLLIGLASAGVGKFVGLTLSYYLAHRVLDEILAAILPDSQAAGEERTTTDVDSAFSGPAYKGV